MERTFLPHQAEAWVYAKDRTSIALFMAMRLGKSIVAIRWIAQHIGKWERYSRVLIVAPLSVLPGWQDELEREGFSSTLLHGSSHQKMRQLQDSEDEFILVNPEGLRACRDIATLIPWLGVILDESTFVMSPKAKISKMCVHNFRDVPLKAILAGEPAPESPLNYFQQMKFLFGQFMGCTTYWQFLRKHFYHAGFDWIPHNAKVFNRIRDAVRDVAFIKTAAQAGISNKVVREKRYVSLPSNFGQLYRTAQKEYRIGDCETKWAIGVTTWLCQLAGGCISMESSSGNDRRHYVVSKHKTNELLDLLRGELRSEPVVVWYHYNTEIDCTSAALKEAGISHRIIIGATPIQLRKAYVKAFHAKKFRIILMQSACGRFGLDLSCASVSIFYSNHWDWLTRAQAEARTQHPLKKQSSLIIDLITKDTLDEAVVKTLSEKKADSRYFLQRVMMNYKKGISK